MQLQVEDFLSKYYNVIDTTTNERIPLVQYVNEKHQILTKYIYNPDGSLKEHFDKINGEWVLDKENLKGNFKLVGKNLFFKLLKKVIDILEK